MSKTICPHCGAEFSPDFLRFCENQSRSLRLAEGRKEKANARQAAGMMPRIPKGLIQSWLNRAFAKELGGAVRIRKHVMVFTDEEGRGWVGVKDSSYPFTVRKRLWESVGAARWESKKPYLAGFDPVVRPEIETYGARDVGRLRQNHAAIQLLTQRVPEEQPASAPPLLRG